MSTEQFNFIASVISSLAWPLTLILLSYFFKREVQALIGRVKGIKSGNLKIELSEIAGGYISKSINSLEKENDPTKRHQLIQEIKLAAETLKAIHPISVSILITASGNTDGHSRYFGGSLNNKMEFVQELIGLGYIMWEKSDKGENGIHDVVILTTKGYEFLVSIGCLPEQMNVKKGLLKS